MSDFKPIPVKIPQPWLWLGRIFVFFCICGSGLLIWQLIFVAGPLGDVFLINSAINFFVTPIAIIFFIPFFIGHYPVWVVRLFGEKWLNKLINDCAQLIGAKRENKAFLFVPTSWFADQRLIWLTILIGAAVLGVLHALP
jgi:hypothetical protein